MNGSLLLAVAVAALGSEFGYRPLPGGGLEYIVQRELHVVEILKEGDDITSDVPANVKDIRSIRFTVGSGELPRINESRVTADPELELPPSAPPEPPQTSLELRDDDWPRELPWKDGPEDGVRPVVMLQDTEPAPVSPLSE